MTLKGKYSCSELSATLTITEANDSNGTGEGSFSMGGVTVPVTMKYHFKNSAGPTTNYVLSGLNNDPNQYVGMAGFSKTAHASDGITLAGGLSVSDGDVAGFSCFFKRV